MAKKVHIPVLAIALILLGITPPASAQSLADHSLDWPSWPQFTRVVLLRDYNTRVVVLGTMLLGTACGIVGTFMLLRKRALVSDAISHATLPGIGIAFLLMTALGRDGKFLPALLLSATVAAILGVGCVLAIRNLTRLKEDAALGIVLSVFFGLGVAVLGIVQKQATGNAAGLESFIYGKTASMLLFDAVLIGAVGSGAILACILFLKEFSLVCFDQEYAAAQGWPVIWMDVVMMALVVAVTVVGLQAVGLILLVALLIIPSAAARFWTDRLGWLLINAAAIGAISGLVGAALSALMARLPAGAIIVAVAGVLFAISMFLGTRRGILLRVVAHVRLRRRVARQHLLRAMYERCEFATVRTEGGPRPPVEFGRLLEERSWAVRSLTRLLRQARRAGLVEPLDATRWRLTERGLEEAAQVTRNHRLWEMYLISHADIAPSHVDRDADMVEHILGRDMVRKLESLLESRDNEAAAAEAPLPPPSPHAVEAAP